jgi:hypothetical protein
MMFSGLFRSVMRTSAEIDEDAAVGVVTVTCVQLFEPLVESLLSVCRLVQVGDAHVYKG